MNSLQPARNTIGVYLITNTVTSLVYVGSSKCIRGRWANHIAYLQKQCHHNPKLQNAYDKYGEDSFLFKVLEVVGHESELQTTEQKWIDFYQASDRTKGFNILPFAYRQIKQPKSCHNCTRTSNPLRQGLCKPCYEYKRRRGINRPYHEDGRLEKSTESDKGLCTTCQRPITIVGRPIKGLCKSCYRVAQRTRQKTRS